jgi:hypothetical protein
MLTVRRSVQVCAKAKGKQAAPPAAAEPEVGTAGLAVAAAGLVANPVVWWSLYTLKTTGAGLPPGPGGALGALGVCYCMHSAYSIILPIAS